MHEHPDSPDSSPRDADSVRVRISTDILDNPMAGPHAQKSPKTPLPAILEGLGQSQREVTLVQIALLLITEIGLLAVLATGVLLWRIVLLPVAIAPPPEPTPTTVASPTPTATVAPPTATSTLTPTATAPAITPTATAEPTRIEILGGTFVMGGARTHEVTLSPFVIDRFEVTNAAYRACVEDDACPPPVQTTDYTGDDYYDAESFAEYPVIHVTWEMARTYCSWQGMRLPTEAEWEMAARWDPGTGQTTRYPWGDEWDGERANHCDASCALSALRLLEVDDGWPQTSPVGSFPAGASPSGAEDMIGNVAEWVNDWFDATYYAVAPDEDPTGPQSGTLRVVRGGAWGINDPDLLTATARSRFDPTSSGPGLGFRCAASP